MPPLTRRSRSQSTLLQSLSDDAETPQAKRIKQEKTDSPSKRIKKEPATPTKPKTKARNKSPKKKNSGRTAPKDWESIYSLVQELREDRTAPVDSDGGHALPQREHGDVVYRFQLLVALMLSSQTKDAVVGNTMRDLQEHGLDMENIRDTPAEELNKLIGKVGFHNNKTKYIKKAVEICLDEYNGDIPPDAQELQKLPGVGPKMAYIIESIAFGKTTGIGVDTHMHRIFNQLKWVQSKNPEQTRVQLQSWLPEEKWPTVNVLWVGFGQEIQQFKPKILKKAIDCSRPAEALRLLKRLGMDLKKEGEKAGLQDEIKSVMSGSSR